MILTFSSNSFCPALYLLRLLTLVLCLMVFSQSLIAQDDEPRGHSGADLAADSAGDAVVDEPQLSEEEQKAQDETRALEISRELSLRLVAIEELQSQGGIYDPTLREAYADLAAFYQEIEDFESADDLYDDALQVVRITSGLFSEEQIPIINELIATNIKMKDWQEVDDFQELKLHISGRIYRHSDTNYLTMANAYGAWKLELMRGNLLEQNYRGLSNTATDLSRFYDRIIADADSGAETPPLQMIGLVYNKTQADLALARAVANTPSSAFEGTVNRYETQTRCQNVRSATGELVRQCVNVQVENPRYRQSQRDAKQFAVNRHTRAIVRAIERLEAIHDQPTGMSAQQIRDLEDQIVLLRNQSEVLLRAGRRQILL